MKKIIATLSILLIAGLARASTDPYSIAPTVPGLYIAPPTGLSPANLDFANQGAVSLLETTLGLAKVAVQAYGCPAIPISAPMTVVVDENGDGSAVIDSVNGQIVFYVKKTNSDPYRGNRYFTDGGTGKFNGKPYAGAELWTTFNKPSSIMDGGGTFSVPNPQSTQSVPDKFQFQVIKDFVKYANYRAQGEEFDRFAVINWGLESVSKKLYPVAKWWERSFILYSDGIEGKTGFKITRLVGGVPCSIGISLHGENETGTFDQAGKLVIRKGGW